MRPDFFSRFPFLKNTRSAFVQQEKRNFVQFTINLHKKSFLLPRKIYLRWFFVLQKKEQREKWIQLLNCRLWLLCCIFYNPQRKMCGNISSRNVQFKECSESAKKFRIVLGLHDFELKLSFKRKNCSRLQSHRNYFTRGEKVSHLSNSNCLESFSFSRASFIALIKENFFHRLHFSSLCLLAVSINPHAITFYATYRKLFLLSWELTFCNTIFPFIHWLLPDWKVNLKKFVQFMVRKGKWK